MNKILLGLAGLILGAGLVGLGGVALVVGAARAAVLEPPPALSAGGVNFPLRVDQLLPPGTATLLGRPEGTRLNLDLALRLDLDEQGRLKGLGLGGLTLPIWTLPASWDLPVIQGLPGLQGFSLDGLVRQPLKEALGRITPQAQAQLRDLGPVGQQAWEQLQALQREAASTDPAALQALLQTRLPEALSWWNGLKDQDRSLLEDWARRWEVQP